MESSSFNYIKVLVKKLEDGIFTMTAFNEQVDCLKNFGTFAYPYISKEKRPLPSIMEKVRHHKKGENFAIYTVTQIRMI